MELLLNLLWLTLALPAFLIWRQQSSLETGLRRASSLRAILLLGCLLVFLFPVVSATDDLHPLHNEIEESNPSRRTVKQASASQSPDWSKFGPPPACLAEIACLGPDNRTCESVSDCRPAFLAPGFSGTRSCRAPPSA